MLCKNETKLFYRYFHDQTLNIFDVTDYCFLEGSLFIPFVTK